MKKDNNHSNKKQLKAKSIGKYLIVEKCKDKKVLEIGCVNHDLAGRNAQKNIGNWLFGHLNDVSQKAVGIDIDKKAVIQLKKEGYEVYAADAQNFDLKQKFDVIVVSAVTDHLLNFEGFFQSCADHLQPGGQILIYEDNILSIPRWIGRWLRFHLYRNERELGMADDITLKPVSFTFKNYVGRFDLKVKEIQYVPRLTYIKILSKIIPNIRGLDRLIYDHYLVTLEKI